MTVQTEKVRIRREVRGNRQRRSADQRDEHNRAVATHLTDLITSSGAQRVLIYLATRDEPQTRDVIRDLSATGVRFFAPVCLPDGVMHWAEVDGNSAERVSEVGTPEPDVSPENLLPTVDADMVVCPAAAVDLSGTRVGWGRGYYDRLLATLSPGLPVFALVGDEDVYEHLPREKHDMPVTGVVTPKGWRRF
ncbi:MAG: 5-formyltetrahydrofolate cyclo-ligase [Actinobacteria bacterium]|uniref:Unannotated protein n=1 Tax=freshwater metagenome TaxID=449393 RepID=A0A6J7G0B5_9ZZZZ|nr:5-formyltetrahydrofolate cyclo-ligase [Actinomycetota bacterium]